MEYLPNYPWNKWLGKEGKVGHINHEYELFKMKPEENISQMHTRFTHIVSHMRNMEGGISNEELVVKIIRCMDHSWQPKVIDIYEPRYLETMDAHSFK